MTGQYSTHFKTRQPSPGKIHKKPFIQDKNTALSNPISPVIRENKNSIMGIMSWKPKNMNKIRNSIPFLSKVSLMPCIEYGIK